MRVSRGKCLGWCTLQTLPMVGAGTQLKKNGVFGGETSWVHRAMVVFRLKTCDFEEKTHVFSIHFLQHEYCSITSCCIKDSNPTGRVLNRFSADVEVGFERWDW